MEYSSGLTSERWFEQDITYVLNLLEKGLSRQAIREIILNENPFLVRTQSALYKRFQLVFKRSSSLSPLLRKLYLNGTKYDQKILILYTFLKTYRYAYENFYELIIYRYQQKNKKIVKEYFQAFMEEKEQQSEKISQWSQKSKNAINNTLLLFYSSSGIIELEADNSIYLITPPYVSNDLKKYAEQNDNLLNAIITLQAGVKYDNL